MGEHHSLFLQKISIINAQLGSEYVPISFSPIWIEMQL